MKYFFLIIILLFIVTKNIAQRYDLLINPTNGSMNLKQGFNLADQNQRRISIPIKITVTPNQKRPGSAIDIILDFEEGVNLENVSGIVFMVQPICKTGCVSDYRLVNYLSTAGIDKRKRSLNYSIGGLKDGQSYMLRTGIMGLDGAACSGNIIEDIGFTLNNQVVKNGKMLLVINNEWQNERKVQDILDQYISDIKIAYPHLTLEKYYIDQKGKSKIRLYKYIQQEYENSNLSYLFFIGANAATEMRTELINSDGSLSNVFLFKTFTNYTYPDVMPYTFREDGSLISKKYQDPCYRSTEEIRTPVYQRNNSLISMGMILPTSRLTESAKIDYVVNYFSKLHRFRNGEILFGKNIVISDGFKDEKGVVKMASSIDRWKNIDVLRYGRTKDYNFSGVDSIWKSDFLEKFGKGSYEIAHFNVHGSPDYHAFGITKSDLDNYLDRINIQLIDINSCNVGMFQFDGQYLAGEYLNKGNVLNVHAYSDLLFSITVGDVSALESAYLFDGKFTYMNSGYNVSDSYRWSNQYLDIDILLGDPLVKFRDKLDTNGQGERIYVYPNPTSDKMFFPSVVKGKLESLTVLNRSGKKMMQMIKPQDDYISLKNLPPGVYVVKFKLLDKSILTFKIALVQ